MEPRGWPPSQSRCVWDSWSPGSGWPRQSCGGPGPERAEQTLIMELLGSRPDSSCFLLALFPDTPLQKMSSLQQLERVPSAGGVWQVGFGRRVPSSSRQITPAPLKWGRGRSCHCLGRPRLSMPLFHAPKKKRDRRGDRFQRWNRVCDPHVSPSCPGDFIWG